MIWSLSMEPPWRMHSFDARRPRRVAPVPNGTSCVSLARAGHEVKLAGRTREQEGAFSARRRGYHGDERRKGARGRERRKDVRHIADPRGVAEKHLDGRVAHGAERIALRDDIGSPVAVDV